jgi:2-succinyl-6-hydroxy-2,4-cyclohexadiene-1-carboxylate synthase
VNVILLHGFLGASSDWAEIQGLLHDTVPHVNLTCTALDVPEVHGWDEAVTWLRAAVEAVPAPRCLVGYSMGGRLCLGLALEAPQLLRGLVLESAHPGLEGELERAHRRELDADRARALRTGPMADFLTAWYSTPFWDSLREDAPRFSSLLARRTLRDRELCAAHIVALSPGVMPAHWSQLRGLSVPSLWIAGSRDAKYTGSSRRAAQLAPGAELVLARAGHNVHHEAPRHFAEVVAAFVSVLTAEAAS